MNFIFNLFTIVEQTEITKVRRQNNNNNNNNDNNNN